MVQHDTTLDTRTTETIKFPNPYFNISLKKYLSDLQRKNCFENRYSKKF
jgi:hypothetical protein